MSPADLMDRSSICEKESDALENFFVRPFFLSVTIGIPFCIFKLLFGVTAIRVSSAPPLHLFGWLVILWAGADFLMNAGRAVFDLFRREAPFEYCTIGQLGRIFHKPLVFLALDTLLTFTIISLMLWSGWIAILTPLESYLWYAATTLNLISLSLVILFTEIKRAALD